MSLPRRLARLTAAAFLGLRLALAASGARADVATGGTYDLTSDSRGPGGSLTAAQYEAIGALQYAAGNGEAAGAYTYLSGYLNYENGFFLLSLLPPNVIYVQDEQAFDVAPAQGIEAQFTTPVTASSLIGATTAYLVYDHQGNFVNQPVPISVSSTSVGANNVLLVSSAGWQMGATYMLALSTGAFDVNGNALITGGTLTFHAQQDFSQNNFIPSIDGSGSGVQIPPGALSGVGFVVVSSDPYNGGAYLAADVAAADAKMLHNDGPQSVPVTLEYVKAFTAAGAVLPLGLNTQSALNTPALLTLDYPAPGANGTIAMTGTPSGIRPDALSLYALDQTSELWEKVPTSSVNPKTDQVDAPVRNFGVYAVISKADADVSTTYAFPVPWRPNGGHDPTRYGLPYGQTEGQIVGGITFTNLPQQGMLRIYTLTGEQIIAVAMTGAEKFVWNGKNSSGSDVVSGTYLWLIDADGNKKTGKLMIIR